MGGPRLPVFTSLCVCVGVCKFLAILPAGIGIMQM